VETQVARPPRRAPVEEAPAGGGAANECITLSEDALLEAIRTGHKGSACGGTGWFVGSGPPPASIPGQITGDLYLDQSNGDVYKLNVAASGTPVASLPAIGAAYEGGYYGGLISQSMNGVATHALIIAPKATGQSIRACKTTGTATTGASSTFDGWANSNAANDAAHPATQWARGLSIATFSDWYIPALFELEILYRRFKPDGSEGNVTTHGANPYAVPASANYTFSSPAQTAFPLFAIGGAQEFLAGGMGTSTRFAPKRALTPAHTPSHPRQEA
jgi:hypothetical protein